MSAPVVHGSVEPGFEGVRDAFAAGFDAKPGMGAALAVRLEGRTVVDLWGGVADERTDRPWQEATPSVIFSCTKGLMAILAARLVQEGRLDYSAPVAQYWPEFARAGKESVTVRDILAHRSGVSAPRVDLTVDDIVDWDRVVGALAEQEPLWEPGTGYAYHAITHGWLVGEVIRRVTGVSPGRYFAQLVAEPLGVDAWIGLPADFEAEVAHLQVGPTLVELTRQQAAARTPGVVDWSERAMTLGGALAPELVEVDGGFNDARIRAAEIPGAGGIATARALATIWSSVIVPTEGVRLLDDDVIAAATRVQSEGAPVWDVPGPWPRWGMGFQLDSEPRRYLTARGFGHDGAGGQCAFADPGAGVGLAYLTNRMEAIDDRRATSVVDAVRDALGLPDAVRG
ncbi:serine hydrolase domain-containing protein [Salinibacterium soli]|uniref:Serine hydrolase domain-containing protein n=1 Tax=Antiquaquibacter soli TaxID=3064523 RepID=A0ABT9BSS7_9MICO|nr:serine hydrolase domain-containing protein [Protaetiibacter sp. WY-16]MDO7883462.1 serine hydrolase domain-containing protein [Protaetiibacter sp. WY-16]